MLVGRLVGRLPLLTMATWRLTPFGVYNIKREWGGGVPGPGPPLASHYQHCRPDMVLNGMHQDMVLDGTPSCYRGDWSLAADNDHFYICFNTECSSFAKGINI